MTASKGLEFIVCFILSSSSCKYFLLEEVSFPSRCILDFFHRKKLDFLLPSKIDFLVRRNNVFWEN